MKPHLSKHGTDRRYPVWSGAVLDPEYLLGKATLFFYINLSALFYIHEVPPTGELIQVWDLMTYVRAVIALTVGSLTAQLLNHPDAYVQRSVRLAVCGLPMALVLLIVINHLVGI